MKRILYNSISLYSILRMKPKGTIKSGIIIDNSINVPFIADSNIIVKDDDMRVDISITNYNDDDVYFYYFNNHREDIVMQLLNIMK